MRLCSRSKNTVRRWWNGFHGQETFEVDMHPRGDVYSMGAKIIGGVVWTMVNDIVRRSRETK